MTPDETKRRYPCDDIVPEATFQAWRGVTVHATQETVWPWVAQIRLAPYSYDWIDNLGRRSPQQLRSLPEAVAGESFTTALGGRRLGRIVAVTPGEHLTARIGSVVMSYVLVPCSPDTRLLLKIVAARWRVAAPLLSVGDLIMARRQLLNLARLAESASSDTAI